MNNTDKAVILVLAGIFSVSIGIAITTKLAIKRLDKRITIHTQREEAWAAVMAYHETLTENSTSEEFAEYRRLQDIAIALG